MSGITYIVLALFFVVGLPASLLVGIISIGGFVEGIQKTLFSIPFDGQRPRTTTTP